MAQADIGLIGLAVMGENLILNMESKGFTVACFNRTVSKVDNFINGRAKGKNIIGCHSIEEFAASLKKPRKVMLMVKAGQAVDAFIDKLLPHLEDGDIIIDGGNSHFPDTIRRTEYVESKGKLYIGTGVSGGEEGALLGPSMMPGGSPAAWEHVKPIFQATCAKTDEGEPCCEWVGENGAGHFVKMTHNGIEYGDMQMICETYQMMKHGLGLTNKEMHEVFSEWKRNITALAACPNAYVKLGGLGTPRCGYGWYEQSAPPGSAEVAEGVAPYFNTCIELFGVERCMFERNFPVDKISFSYNVMWNAFKRLAKDFTPAERAALFHDTAVKVYRLTAR